MPEYADDEDDFQEEEAVEIDCGVVNSSEDITCKICWGNE
jgi:hypothetical protein